MVVFGFHVIIICSKILEKHTGSVFRVTEWVQVDLEVMQESLRGFNQSQL
jgi:hypothetical protein